MKLSKSAKKQIADSVRRKGIDRTMYDYDDSRYMDQTNEFADAAVLYACKVAGIDGLTTLAELNAERPERESMFRQIEQFERTR